MRLVILVGFILLAGFGGVGCGRSKETASNPSETTTDKLSSVPSQNALSSANSIFRDVTDGAGIHYRWEIVGKRPLNILQTIGNGCAFLDYDGDGNLDILLVGFKLALYKGDGKGAFTEVTSKTGLDKLKGNFHSCAVGDIDNDGHDDVYLSAYRGGVMLHNEGGESFRDISSSTGIPSQPFGTTCAFGDINGDGYLDLFIGNYIKFGPDTRPQLCDNNGVKGACGPRFYEPEKGALFLGGKGMRFQDVTKAWNIHLSEGKALGSAFADYNNSGKLSLAIANDEVPGDLLSNKNGKFENVGKSSGVAYDDSGKVHGGMGLDWGDYDNDGKLDLALAAFATEAKCIYRNDGDDVFSEKSAMLGLGPSNPYVTFGIKWLDYDNDGYLDLILCNGHVQDNISESDKTMTYRQPTQLYHNAGGGHFEDMSVAGLDEKSRRPIVGRGLAIGDYDNDGKIDVLIVDSEGRPLLLHNEMPAVSNWVGFKLTPPSGVARNAYGAMISLEAGGKKYLRHCHADGSFMASSDSRIHFGLGDAKKIDKVTIVWLNGKKDSYSDIPLNRYVNLPPVKSSKNSSSP